MSIEDDIIVKHEEWRVGRKVPLNVYDERDQPVCQCQNAAYAELIVKAVNASRHYAAREREVQELVRMLTLCREKFREYAEHHLAKNTMDGAAKAIANSYMAEGCNAALAPFTAQGEHHDR